MNLNFSKTSKSFQKTEPPTSAKYVPKQIQTIKNFLEYSLLRQKIALVIKIWLKPQKSDF